MVVPPLFGFPRLRNAAVFFLYVFIFKYIDLSAFSCYHVFGIFCMSGRMLVRSVLKYRGGKSRHLIVTNYHI